jgi:hypothetical protein
MPFMHVTHFNSNIQTLKCFSFSDSRGREPPRDRQRVALPARDRPLSGDPADVVAPILSRISKIFAHHKTERTGS